MISITNYTHSELDETHGSERQVQPNLPIINSSALLYLFIYFPDSWFCGVFGDLVWA
jgi:hypothetical protein